VDLVEADLSGSLDVGGFGDVTQVLQPVFEVATQRFMRSLAQADRAISPPGAKSASS
jgi:hypothetical protein